MEHELAILTLKNLGLLVFGTGGLVMAGFMVYYIAFALTIIFGSIYSAYAILATAEAEESEVVLSPLGQLGFTMPDGGHPIDEEEKRENEK